MKNIIGGCPDCDGDLVLITDKGNNIYELKCNQCNSIFLTTIVGIKDNE